jgi:hypothetical protein
MEALRAAVRKTPTMLDTKCAQKLGAAAFEKTQIGGVIDDTGKIRVLIIDSNRRCGAGKSTDSALPASFGSRRT